MASPDPAVRQAALMQFSHLPKETQERFVPSLMVAMSSDDAGVRLDAARTLRSLGISSDQTAKDLRKENPRTGESSRMAAYREVQAAKGEFPDIESALASERPAPVDAETQALAPSLGQAAIDQSLIAALDDPDPLLRSHAARKLALQQPVPAETLPKLIGLLSDSEAEVRASAASAIASMGPRARLAVPGLLKLVGDPDPGVRVVAADALQQVQPQP